MTPKTLNISRPDARAFIGAENFPEENVSWISISEPEDFSSIVSNNKLDSLPNLKISFWDVCETTTGLWGEIFEPPTKNDAAGIVDFLVKNKGRNILVNCAAGISRSGAVCAFLEKHLGYEWLEQGKKRTYKKHGPNKKLLELMEEYYYA